MEKIKLVVITGLSGSGKSHALKALEDLGYFCVDNLPPRFLPPFIRACKQWLEGISRIGVTVDIRERAFLRDFPRVYHYFKNKKNIDIEVLFLEASEDILLCRFSETRRPHPLAYDKPVLDGIKEEKYRMQTIRQFADEIIDTSALTVHQLRKFIFMKYQQQEEQKPLLLFMSFGYRYGVPFNADIVWDVRFIPNPYFQEELRFLTGLDREVRAFMLKFDITRKTLRYLNRMLRFLLEQYKGEMKHYITVAIGCTGGKHRSVAFVEWLARLWRKKRWRVEVEHRDIQKL